MQMSVKLQYNNLCKWHHTEEKIHYFPQAMKGCKKHSETESDHTWSAPLHPKKWILPQA